VEAAIGTNPSSAGLAYVDDVDLSYYKDILSMIQERDKSLETIARGTDLCADFDSSTWSRKDSPTRRKSVRHVLSLVTQKEELQNCSSVASLCNNHNQAGKLVRFHCPETCGCQDVSSGLLLSGPSWGCPVACRFGFARALVTFNANCSDMETGSMSPLTRYMQNIYSMYREVLNATLPEMLADGCRFFANKSLTIRGYAYSICESGDVSLLGLRSVGPYCPNTCFCASYVMSGTFSSKTKPECPGQCYQPYTATEGIMSFLYGSAGSGRRRTRRRRASYISPYHVEGTITLNVSAPEQLATSEAASRAVAFSLVDICQIDKSTAIRVWLLPSAWANPTSTQCCNESLIGESGHGYRGCRQVTRSGRPCQKWTQQWPHEHSSTPADLPDTGLGNHNFCRNPSHSSSIWCYTMDPGRRWEICDPIASCCDETLSGTKGTEYRGCQSKTRTGKVCQRWTSSYPHDWAFNPEAYPDAGLGSHNFCRNPGSAETIWCHTTDPNTTAEFCNPQASPRIMPSSGGVRALQAAPTAGQVKGTFQIPAATHDHARNISGAILALSPSNIATFVSARLEKANFSMDVLIVTGVKVKSNFVPTPEPTSSPRRRVLDNHPKPSIFNEGSSTATTTPSPTHVSSTTMATGVNQSNESMLASTTLLTSTTTPSPTPQPTDDDSDDWSWWR